MRIRKKIWDISFAGASLLLGTTFTSCGANRSIPENGKISVGNIVNGKSVTNKNKNSHTVVAIIADKNEGQALCTGTLVAPNVVLTAAHCVDDNPSKLHIVFSLNVPKVQHENVREVDQFLQHPNWGRHLSSGEGDIALIHFRGELPLDYAPVTLANKNLKLKNGQKVLMIGYGVTDGESESDPGKLRQARSVIIDRHSPTEMVIDGQQSSVCFGDSGGPAFVIVNKDIIQWGVASSVTNRACNEASIHTEVMKYEDWIMSSIEKMGN